MCRSYANMPLCIQILLWWGVTGTNPSWYKTSFSGPASGKSSTFGKEPGIQVTKERGSRTRLGPAVYLQHRSYFILKNPFYSSNKENQKQKLHFKQWLFQKGKIHSRQQSVFWKLGDRYIGIHLLIFLNYLTCNKKRRGEKLLKVTNNMTDFEAHVIFTNLCKRPKISQREILSNCTENTW